MSLPYCEEFIKPSNDDLFNYEIVEKLRKNGWSDYDPSDKETWWK